VLCSQSAGIKSLGWYKKKDKALDFEMTLYFVPAFSFSGLLFSLCLSRW